MVVSKTKIKLRIRNKSNSELAETIRLANNNKAWNKIAFILSGATRNYSSINLKEIDKKTTAGDTVIIPGKVLSTGSLTKKVRICALGISAVAKEKLKESKSEFASILDEIKSNLKAEGIKVIQNGD